MTSSTEQECGDTYEQCFVCLEDGVGFESSCACRLVAHRTCLVEMIQKMQVDHCRVCHAAYIDQHDGTRLAPKCVPSQNDSQTQVPVGITSSPEATNPRTTTLYCGEDTFCCCKVLLLLILGCMAGLLLGAFVVNPDGFSFAAFIILSLLLTFVVIFSKKS